MENIPNISFKSEQETSDIEIIPLKELFAKIRLVSDHNPRKLHRLNFFALMIISEGEGVHQVDLNRYPIQKGDVVKIAKGQVHAFQEPFTYKGYMVIFKEDLVLKYFSKSSVNYISHLYNYHISAPVVKGNLYNDFFINQLKKEFQNENRYVKKEIMAKMLELYLLRLEQQAHHERKPDLNHSHQQLFFAFKHLVEQHFHENRNVNYYADLLSISPKHLNVIVRSITLNTAKNFIDQFIILEIKRSILSSDKRLKTIAYEMGFDEVTNFTKFFKKHTGQTPKTFQAS
ncbi:AraC family transcriptional regulator [Persicobacter sp. CCB-QB2]|uniref:AraC family transcriptional regulator n=1 Tax=Persicobacter sp. CCB-QB2 TaxID=1561025 RepID=UPI0006A9981C|nr:helix-turn-helix domain-containing protein [Persicobacter sp. CCB-QB2]